MAIAYPAVDALTVQQVRELDVLAIEHVGIPGLILMENAGRNVAEFIYATLVDPDQARVVVLCGPGNNGGDGFVVARHLHNAGIDTSVVLAAPPERSSGDAGVNLAILQRMSVALHDASTLAAAGAARRPIDQATLIVDALLGTGSRGDPRGTSSALIAWANAAEQAIRIAIDIPSGLDADTGAIGDPCFRAAATVTLLAPKVGFAAPAARAVLGRLLVADIGLPRALIPRQSASAGA